MAAAIAPTASPLAAAEAAAIGVGGAATSDLDIFVLTRYDPLLQIVKQLTARVQEIEAARIRDVARLDSLEEARHAHQGLDVRLCRMEAAWTAEKLSASPSGKPSSGDRAAAVPQQAALVGGSSGPSVRPASEKAPAASAIETAGQARPTAAPAEDPVDSAPLDAPWLFKVAAATPLTTIESTLGFDDALGTATVQLDAHSWSSELDMWHAVASGLEGTPGLSGDLRGRSGDRGAAHLAAVEGLARACLGEVLLLVHGVPSRAELTAGYSQAGAHHADNVESSQRRIRCIALLAVEVQRQWEAISASRPVDELGRIVLVLAGDGVGGSLRAGSKKFPIEPLF
eukprot:gnl/TRDRNA2_/TRDRNA2_194752_c0_seq1.p1 gnl/TRDRNA2_/TRDRNA2_194752_c0~~gnl/TRDRNA2_/TRDRNA2_194752_c0_seq1.p1  ORF type:complete len:356 (+),score=62.57 gnl/TRDRNA2_/TRDRNA2_194752_c0_seq1:45-1070(+)